LIEGQFHELEVEQKPAPDFIQTTSSGNFEMIKTVWIRIFRIRGFSGFWVHHESILIIMEIL